MMNKLQPSVATKMPFSFLIMLNAFCLKLFEQKGLRKQSRLILLLLMFSLFTIKGFSQLTVEPFESGIPTDWTIFGNGVGTIDWSATTNGYLGTNAVSINPSADNIGDQNTAEYYLVTPQFVVPNNGEIHFYTKQASDIDNGAEYQIRISTASQPDINGFNVVLASFTETTLNMGSQTTYEKKVVEIPSSIPAGLNVYIAFVAVNTQNGATPTGDEWFVDDVVVLEGCEEIADIDFTIDNTTTSGADLAWAHPVTTNFEVQVVAAGDPPATTGTLVAGYTHVLNNLAADTSYDVYIRAICDNSTVSNWSGPYNFNTQMLGLSCNTPIVVPDISTTPYVLTDNLMNYSNPDITYTTEGTNCVSGSTQNLLNGDKIFLSYTAPMDGLITITQTSPGYDPSNPLGDCYNSDTSVLVYADCADVGVTCIAGMVTTYNMLENQIQNLLVQAGQTYIIVVSSLFSPGTGICFELEIDGAPCAPPSGITYSDLTESSVSFSWDNIGGFADSWEYIAVATGSGEPTAAGTPTATNVDNVINSGLAPGTTYDLYVRSVCGGIPGNWSDPYTFTTQCTAFATPYFTDFATATPENPEPCWTVLDVNNDGVQWNYEYGIASMRINDFSAGNINNNHDILVSPKVNFDGVVQKRLRFKYNSYQGSSVYAIKLSTTGVGEDNFTTVLLPETQVPDLGWQNYQELIINIPISVVGEVNVAWIIEPNAIETANSFSIDDVFIEDKPACPNPLSPMVDAVSATTADLSWTQGDVETQWQIVVQDAGLGTPTIDGDLVGATSTTVDNLLSAHQYEYYVRAYCNDVEQSEWVGPTPFITDCTTFDTPFYESFDDTDPDTQKFCWSVLNVNDDDALWMMNQNEPSIQGSNSWFNPTTGYDDWLISPAINVDGVKELKFDYRAQFSIFHPASRFGLEILISTTDTDPSSFTVIEPLFEFINTDYQEKSVYFQATGTVYIAFRVPPEFSIDEGTSILNIDDVYIVDAPACPAPSSLAVNTTYVDGADLSWSPGFQETAWNIVVQPSGTGTPTGTGDAIDTNSFSASGLSPNTEYEFYVMADCGADNSAWVGPMTFTTLCTAFPTPFLETFESDSNSIDCWRVFDADQSDVTWLLNTTMYPYEGALSSSMFTGSNGDNDDWMISPTITVTSNQRLRYYYRVNNGFFAEDLEVLLSTNGIGLDQFTTVLYDSGTDTVLINNVVYKEKVINLPDGITGDINIAFHIPFYPPAPEGYRGQSIFIDNVIVEDIPSCPDPSNLSITNITDVSMDVAWEANGSETEWEISVQPYGTDAPVGDTDPSYLYTTSTNPFNISDLDPAVKYEVYVRAICSDLEQSGWIGPVEVTTKCSFANLCEYTIILSSDSSFGVGGGIDVIQNEQVVQTLEFPTGPWGQVPPPAEYTVFLCTGVEFSLFWDSIGTAPDQYPGAQVEVQDYQGNTVWTSPMGIGTPRTVLYTGIAVCGAVTCPQPENLTASATSVLSWTAGGSETQWEVAIQPIDNGTLPQSGTVVNTPSYTPVADDFMNADAATYEFFVRAICGGGDNSYWSGPYSFVRNDDVSTALTLPVNDTESCDEAVVDVTFRNVSVSPEAMNCDGINEGDVWFEFTAASRVHIIEVNGFTGNFYDSSGDELYPDLTMTLYHQLTNGSLEELTCSKNNTIVASYMSELVVGDTYKVRLTLHTPVVSTRAFHVCVTTPEDFCQMNAVNYGFERPIMPFSAIQSISQQHVVPGWRSNLTTWNSMFIWNSLISLNFTAYSGSQCVQLLTDPDATEADINGLYKDFDSSEITLFDYSFALQTRSDGNIVQLYAGPPEGPFELIHEELAQTAAWTLQTGTYEVPSGQTTTRFLFKSKNNGIGILIDDANFVANTSIDIDAVDPEVDCTDPTVNISAEGVGTWEASVNNPGEVVISNLSANDITISGFEVPGSYTFTWRTRYCEDSITLNYSGLIAATDFSYAQAAYCSDHSNILPELADGFTQGGTFSAETGLVIDATTGEINMGASTAGEYVVTYEVADDPDNCVTGGTSTFAISIADAIEVTVSGECQDGEYWLTAVTSGNVDELSYVWTDAMGTVVGNDSDTFNVTAYASQNPDTTVPTQFTVTVQNEGCSTMVSFTTSTLNCYEIPKGISPDGNGKNDTFNLTGFNVIQVEIFNRYGKEVYSFKGDYTTQWHGQSNNGDTLPDGTYFYNVKKRDGSSQTGWVYIIRPY